MNVNPVLDYLLPLLYPPKCMFCGRLLKDEDAEYCAECFGSLPDYDGAEPTVPGFGQVIATFSYEGPARNGLLRFKFHGLRGHGAVFGKWMAGTVRDKLKEPCDLVSWVPCSGLRRWQRGYDQAEVLARVVSGELGLDCCRVLWKKRHTPAQSGLKGEAQRRANVLGAYAPYKPERWRGKRILLIDDILTTGATLSECGRVLQAADAGGLVCAVAAVTESQKEKI